MALYNGAVEYPCIVKTPGICGGAPRLDGHRIRVSHVAAMSELQGLTPDEIAQAYQLTLAEIHAALTYYFDHLDEFRPEWRDTILTDCSRRRRSASLPDSRACLTESATSWTRIFPSPSRTGYVHGTSILSPLRSSACARLPTTSFSP